MRGRAWWQKGLVVSALALFGSYGESSPGVSYAAPGPVAQTTAPQKTAPQKVTPQKAVAPAPRRGGQKAATAPPLVLPKIPEVKQLPPLTYESKGRPDPFRSLLGREGGDSKGLTVASVKLVGIIQGRQGPLALIEASDGLGYIVKPGDVVGDGKVADISRDSITFQVARRGPFVLRLRTE